MTKKLEELFNIASPESESSDLVQVENVELLKTAISNADTAIDKIDAALPGVRDLEATDNELDELADLAKNTFNNLVDLSMNVDPKLSGPILQSASTILGHAVTAKTAKIDKKLRMIDLQLKKARLDKTMANNSQSNNVIESEGMVMDRNDLIREILNSKPKNTSAHK